MSEVPSTQHAQEPHLVDGQMQRMLFGLKVLRLLGILGFVAVAAILIWGTVFGGVNTGPMQSVFTTIPFGDKGAHFLVYGALTFALSLIVQRPPIALSGAALITALGALDEIRQRFVSGRTFEVADMVANGVGAVVGLVIALALLELVNRQIFEHEIA